MNISSFRKLVDGILNYIKTFNRFVVWVVAVIVIGLTAFIIYSYFFSADHAHKDDAMGGGSRTFFQSEVVALVDGHEITNADITPLIDAGVDRAIAVDRTINKVLVANAAKKLFPTESVQAIQTAERDLLSSLFLRLKRDQIKTMVSDVMITDYYENKITQEQFDTYKIRYYLTADKLDADQVRSLLEGGDKDAMGKLEYFNKDAPFISLAAMPYNLGRLVKDSYPINTKTAVLLGPMAVRNGFIILMVDAFKPGIRPELSSELKSSIQNQLIENVLSSNLSDLRSSAKIIIK